MIYLEYFNHFGQQNNLNTKQLNGAKLAQLLMHEDIKNIYLTLS
jgi:hypothetical protein